MEWCFMCGVTSFTNVWNHNQRCNDIYTCSSPEVCFLSNCGEWSIRRHWCLIDFSYHAGNRVAKQQPGTYWRHHQVLTSTVWQLSQYSDSIEAGPHVVCFLAEARDILSISRTSDQSWGPSGLLFSGCCGSFPSVEAADAWGWSLSCVFCWGYTSVQLWFPCMSSLCTQGQYCLSLWFWSNDFTIYVDIILFRRKWGRYGVN